MTRTQLLPYIRVLTLFAATCLVLLPACQTRPQGIPENAVIVGLADSGSLVRLEPGQEVVVNLNSNPVTGFQWEINHQIDQTILLPNASKFKQSSKQRSQGDEVGTQYLRFVAQQPGRTMLNLVYVQPTVGTLPDSPKYSLEVIVAPRPTTSK